MATFKLLISLLLLVPTNWALSMTSSDSLSVSSISPPSNKGKALNTKESAAGTLGDLYRKSRQSRCARCYDDRYGEDYDRTRYNPSGGRGGGGSAGGGYPSRTYDDRASGNWYYPRETYDRYEDSRVRYGGDRDNDRYYYPPQGYYYDRNEDRYNTRSYDRYDSRDRSESRYPSDRSPSETRGYGYGYGSENRDRDRYYPNDRSNEYYRGGDRYPDRYRGSSGGTIYDRYGQDDRYYSRYDYRNYRPWDETYSRGQSGFDNSGRGYYFANERPNDYYEPPPYHSQSRPLGPGPSTPGPTYLPRDPHDQSRPSNSHGYSDSRPGSSSSSSPSSSSSSSSSASGSDYGNRPRDDVHGHGSSSNDGGGGGGGSGGGDLGGNRGSNGNGDNKNGYTGGSWSYVNDREKDASYKGGIRDKDNQSSSYGGGRGRPLSGSYLLDRDNNVPETSLVSNQDKPGDINQINDSPTASKLTSSPSSTSNNEDRVTESKASN